MFDDRKEITLKELGELCGCGEKIKIISANDGKVLIYQYNRDKHEAFAELKVSGIFTELRMFGGTNNKSLCEPVLVGWASTCQYKELKKAAKEAMKNA